MSGLLGYFSWDKKTTTEPKKEGPQAAVKQQPVRALPASWYTSPEMYELERRGIFSNRWLFMTSTLRVLNAGDYVRYQFAGFDVIIMRNQENDIAAFHNTSKQSQKALIDDTTLEASGTIELTQFSTRAADIFPIHTHIDRNGFIWINLDASPTPQIPFSQFFANVDVQERYTDITFSNYTLHHIYTLPCRYNWKLAAENFNECYHCPTTHADIPSFLNLDSFDSALQDGHIQHFCTPTRDQLDAGVNVHSTFYFPVSSMTVGRHFLMVQKFLARSPDETLCHYEIFKHKTSSDGEFHLIADMYERVMREDKVLCTGSQANLQRGVFGAGWLHPRFEKAPIFFQGGVREAIREHAGKEKAKGEEMWPAWREGIGGGRLGLAGGEAEGNGDGEEGPERKVVLAW